MTTLLGLLRLAALLARSGFRLRGAYWTWRTTTAMGPPDMRAGLSARERLRATLEYARWMQRMRRLS